MGGGGSSLGLVLDQFGEVDHLAQLVRGLVLADEHAVLLEAVRPPVTSAETSWRAAIARSGQSMREWIDDATAKAAEVTRDNAEIQESLRARRGADPELLQERMFTFGLECVLDGFAARVGS